MLLHRIKRKLHKLTHPVVGEIWMLHRVVEQEGNVPEHKELEVTAAWLEQKINEYRSQGYTFVSIDSLPEHGRWVCLTFDDGYRDNYTLAYPMLKRLGVPFTVYVTTGLIDNKQELWWYPGEHLGLSTDELRLLDADPLCTIGAHTVSHPKLDTLTREQQYQEIANSKQSLEQLLGHTIQHFSFPHGAHNADTLSICRELEFLTVVQSWGGPVRHNEHPFPLPRTEITQP